MLLNIRLWTSTHSTKNDNLKEIVFRYATPIDLQPAMTMYFKQQHLNIRTTVYQKLGL